LEFREVGGWIKLSVEYSIRKLQKVADFRTICLFGSRHAEGIKEMFVEVIKLCAGLGMVGLGHIAFVRCKGI
jgi:hypothetical protein